MKQVFATTAKNNERRVNMDILSFIPSGEANAISRKDLAAATGLSDRGMRECIEQARHNGSLICSARQGGYYQPDSVDDIERAYWQDYARAKAILHRLKTMRHILKREGRKVYGERS
jgi:biotin operon repressor